MSGQGLKKWWFSKKWLMKKVCEIDEFVKKNKSKNSGLN